MEVTCFVRLHQDSASSQKRGVGHEGEGTCNVGDAQDRGRGEDLFQSGEGSLLRFHPGPGVIFAGKKDNGGNDVGKVRDKFLVEVRKPEERTDALDRGGGLPILDGRELGWIHAYITLTDDHTKIFHGRGIERAFGDLERETVFMKACEDTTGVLVVQFEIIFGVYPQVVHINFEPSLSDHVSKDMIHEHLKGQRGITEAKEHDSGFEETERGDKCCFPLIFLLDANVVIAPSNIKLGEQCRVFHIID